MWDWQILHLIFSRSSLVKRAGAKASTKTVPSQLFLWKNGLCNEGISNLSYIGRTPWPASKPNSSTNGKLAHPRPTFLSSSVGRHGYHRNEIFLSRIWDCRFSKVHHFWEESALFLAKWRLLSLRKNIFMLHFKFQPSDVSSFDKKRGASNALRVEEGICFPFVKHKSIENIFLMFEKQNKMKHTVKPMSSSWLGTTWKIPLWNLCN